MVSILDNSLLFVIHFYIPFSVVAETDLLNLSGPSIAKPMLPEKAENPSAGKTWYDIFADLDPLGNPDAIGDKEKDAKEMENRYC